MTPLLLIALFAVAPFHVAPREVEGPTAPAAQAQSRSPQTPAWTYDPQGRRDPFVSLRDRGANASTTQNRPPGLAGVTVAEIVIRGIVRSGNEFIALAQAPDGRSFQLRRNARLFDGVVKQIGIDAVVFTQQVNDPLSLVKQREVRKTMKPGDREEEL
ncbi:MAG: hypothetical protein WD690_05265 [Vicinamibacterales bacterium]